MMTNFLCALGSQETVEVCVLSRCSKFSCCQTARVRGVLRCSSITCQSIGLLALVNNRSCLELSQICHPECMKCTWVVVCIYEARRTTIILKQFNKTAGLNAFAARNQECDNIFSNSGCCWMLELGRS